MVHRARRPLALQLVSAHLCTRSRHALTRWRGVRGGGWCRPTRLGRVGTGTPGRRRRDLIRCRSQLGLGFNPLLITVAAPGGGAGRGGGGAGAVRAAVCSVGRTCRARTYVRLPGDGGSLVPVPRDGSLVPTLLSLLREGPPPLPPSPLRRGQVRPLQMVASSRHRE